MQLFAANENDQPVFANSAVKQKDYHCFECRGIVRLRSGIHRQKHFYHTQAAPHCYQQGKGIVHLMTQMHLLNILTDKEARLEVRFPEIHRIADVAWESQKIVFEVQCAPITREEVRARNLDYQKMGWQVIWILHDQRYNQKRISAAEFFLRSHTHYFTNIDREGHGIIYDQFDLYYKGLKTYRMGPLLVDLRKPLKLQSHIDPHKLSLKASKERCGSWRICFENDLIDLSKKATSEYIVEAKKRELEFYLSLKEPKIKKFLAFFIRPYQLAFQMLLEKLCR